MENTTATSTPKTDTPAADDPRFAFAQVTDLVGQLIEGTTPDMMANATPCEDFTVKELLEHLTTAMRQLAGIGETKAWPGLEDEAVDQGWADDYRAAAHQVMLAWGDPALLGEMIEVPWATLPGAALLHTYTGELAAHGWDLAQATGRDFSIDDDLLGGALIAAGFIPVEGRDDPDMPFGPVVVAGPNASVLDQIAGLFGRNVLG